MWLAAEKNQVRHALFQESIPAILFAKTFNSLGVQRAGKIELGVTNQLEHRQGRCLNCESVMDSNDFFTVDILKFR